MDVTIGRRFNGPPSSGNGGYVCGLVAGALGGGLAGDPVQVTLRRPPAIDRALRLDVTGGAEGDGDDTGATAGAGATAGDVRRARLLDGDDVVAEAVPGTLDGAAPLPDPIGFDEAEKLVDAFDRDDYEGRHPFPTCFACGPDRAPGDGLRLFPGAVAPGLVAWPWRPDESLATGVGGEDVVAPEFVWAALDCPSGLCWFHERPPVGPHVLGRMTGALHRLPRVGEPLVAAGWLVEVAGRKRLTGSVVWDAGGGVVAENRATWIGLDGDQLAQFGTAGGPPV